MTSPPVVDERASSSPARRSPTTPARTRPAARCAAFDARTGALKWTWDPVPQDRTDPAYARPGAARWRQKGGGANAWSVLAADPGARPRVRADGQRRAPTTTAASASATTATRTPSSRCARRPDSVVWALPDRASRPLGLRQRLAAGARDRSPTTARASPAVLQANKTGMLFVLDRDDGRADLPGRGAPGSGERHSRRRRRRRRSRSRR